MDKGKEEIHYCDAYVSHPRMFSPSRCGNKGKVLDKGKWLCGTHSPEAEAKRRAASDKKWQEQSKKLNGELARAQQRRDDAQRYQALRARIGDTAIGALMAGEAAVVPMACSTGLIHSVDYHDDTASPIPIPSFRAFHIDKIRLDHPAEEPSK